MRRSIALLILLAACLTTSTATALTFLATATIDSGRSLDAPNVGDLITINLRMSNPTGAAIYGVGAGVQGWNESVLAFVSAEMNTGPYFCTTTACTSGLTNGLPLPTDPDTGHYTAGPSDVQSLPGVGNYFPLVQAISTTGRSGSGARDPGLDGIANGGDAQFRLIFRVVGAGVTTIQIGTNPDPILGNVVVLAGGVTEQADNVYVTSGWVPEPGTALLLGLGLAGLAASGRRA